MEVQRVLKRAAKLAEKNGEREGKNGNKARWSWHSAPGTASEMPCQVPNRDYMREPSFKKNPTARRKAVGKSKHTMRKLGTR